MGAIVHVGDELGCSVGGVGVIVGWWVGARVGSMVGIDVGFKVGDLEGAKVGW